MFTTPYLFQIWLYVLRQSSFGDSKGQSFDTCSHFQFIPNIRKNSCVISFCFFFYSHVVRIITFLTKMTNVGGKILTMIKALYENTQQRVCLNWGNTKWFKSDIGLKQGCVLSPLLFALYLKSSGEKLLRGAVFPCGS